MDQVFKPDPFSLFFKFDQGPAFRLAGIPIESRFYLFGNVTIAQGLFTHSPVSGLGAPVRFCVSQRDGEEETRIDIDEPSSFFSQLPGTQGLQRNSNTLRETGRTITRLRPLCNIRYSTLKQSCYYLEPALVRVRT